ncbi:MAG TPA: zinc-binding dehydrogenase, partial [Stellaceae bacterium]|nr:zinc-binding dehydrogenase [Stellaceae bacterium]
RRGIVWRALDLEFAFHSTAMEPIRNGLLSALRDISSTAPGNFYSTVTDDPVAVAALGAVHWWRNIREPVRFAPAIETMIAAGYRIFVEIGPRPVLLHYLSDALDQTETVGRVVPTLDSKTEDDPFPGLAARLHIAGCDMSRAPWLDGPQELRGLPLYPWQRERHWISRTTEATDQINPKHDHPLLGFCQNAVLAMWLNHVDAALFPFLGDHRVEGVPVLPAAAIVDMALAAAGTRHPDAAAIDLRDLELRRPMTCEEGVTRETHATLLPDGEWRLASRPRLSNEAMILHATARLAPAPSERLLQFDNRPKSGGAIPAAALYRMATRCGLDYGHHFRTVQQAVVIGCDRVAIELGASTLGPDNHLLDPTLLDGALQGLLALLPNDAFNTAMLLPRRIARVRAFTPFGRPPTRAEVQLVRRGTHSVIADIILYDGDDVVAELVSSDFARIDRTQPATGHVLRTDLVPAPLPPMTSPIVFDRIDEILRDAAAIQRRDDVAQSNLRLLFEALLASIAAETVGSLPEPLEALLHQYCDASLPESDELWRLLLAENPAMVTELTLAATLRETLQRGEPFIPPPAQVAALRQASLPAVAGREAIAAVLDGIAARWPPSRPLRINETGSSRLSERLYRSGITVLPVARGETCDIAICTKVGAIDVSTAAASLAPGGLLLALMPQLNTLWELISDRSGDWRSQWSDAGFGEVGSAQVSIGPWPCELAWARRTSLPEIGGRCNGRFIEVVGHAPDPAFITALQAVGHRAASVGEESDIVAVLFDSSDDPVAAASEVLSLLAEVAAAAAKKQVPLWLLTCGVYQPTNNRNLIGAAAWGFARTLRNEIPGLTLHAIDFAPDLGWAARGERFANELLVETGESEVVWTRHGRSVPRVRRGLPTCRAEADSAVYASTDQPGQLDRLHWKLTSRHLPGPGEIEVEVRATGLNFRDVMAATGVLPEETLTGGFAGAALGLECAGVVCAVGAGVEEFSIGDRVAALASGALASHVVTPAGATIPIPRELDFAAAATVPVAFVTARYALHTLAQLRPGETVLIHAASGGVGLAAIQLAKTCGAVVIATAGSPAKRAFLRLVGADHVCDSRKLRFVSQVREATGSEGVDVVLNSLSGEATEASLELLKPFGR